MKSVFLLRATHIDGNEIAAGSIAEVDDAIASALISDGAADAHPSAIDAAKKSNSPVVRFAVDAPAQAAVAAPQRKQRK